MIQATTLVTFRKPEIHFANKSTYLLTYFQNKAVSRNAYF